MGKRKSDEIEDNELSKKVIKSTNESKINHSKTVHLINYSTIKTDISVLTKFVDLLGDDDDFDLISGYLKVGDGSELLQWLTGDKDTRKITELRLAMEALTAVLFRIAGDLSSSYAATGRRIGEILLDEHLPSIYRCMSPSGTASNLKTALRLLTGMTMQGVDIAHGMIRQFGFDHPNFKGIAKRRNTRDETDVRSCWVNFVASFFIVGNNLVIREMVEKKDTLHLLIGEALIDKFSNVMLIIKILHEKIILNRTVSKTKKCQLFSRWAIEQLLRLYGWHGEARNIADARARVDFTEEELSAAGDVHRALHALLLDLFTSHRLGIAFTDNKLGCDSQNANGRLLNTLSSMDRPHHADLQRELVLRTVASCPDLLSSYVTTLVPHFVPRPSDNWTLTVDFVEQLYGGVKNVGKLLSRAEQESSPEVLVKIMADLTLPPAALGELIGEAVVHESKMVQKRIKTLLKMFQHRVRIALTWLNTATLVNVAERKDEIKANLKATLPERIQSEKWIKKIGDLFDLDLKDVIPEDEEPGEEEDPTIDIVIDQVALDEEQDKKCLKQLNKNSKHAVRRLLALEGENVPDPTDLAKVAKKWSSVFKDCISEFYTEPLILRALAVGISLLYAEGVENRGHLEVSEMVSMVIGHEQFRNVLARKDGDTDRLKGALLTVMVELVKVDPKACVKKYPLVILFSSYGATLSSADQKLLYLIYTLESNGLNVSAHKPYMWGPRVLDHYRVQKDLSSVVWLQPAASSILGQLDERMVSYTALHFPMKRRWLEYQSGAFNLHPASSDLYDPCFLLHIFSIYLQEGLVTDPRGFLSRGLLSLCVASLTSYSRHVRGLGRSCIARYYALTEKKGFPEAVQVRYIINCLRHSMADSGGHRARASPADPYDRMTSIHAHFFVRTLAFLMKPDHRMFTVLWDYILKKPTIDLTQVPEFLRLLFSADKMLRVDRQWLFTLLAEGMREESDYLVMEKSHVFKNLLLTYMAPTTDPTAQLLILRLLAGCVEIPRVVHCLIRYHVITTWLHRNMVNAQDDVKLTLFGQILTKMDATLNSGQDVTTHFGKVVRLILRIFREKYRGKYLANCPLQLKMEVDT